MATEPGIEKRKKNLKPAWKPGQSGNPAGRPKKEFTLIDNLEEAAQAAVKGKNKTKLLEVCHKMFDLALGGDIQAAKLIFNTLSSWRAHSDKLEIYDRLEEIEKALNNAEVKP